MTDHTLAPDIGQKDRIGYDIANNDGDEAKPRVHSIKIPLLEDKREGLDAGEDQGIGEAGEQGQEQHDGLEQEHLKGTAPDAHDFHEAQTLLLQLIRSVHIGVFASLASSLGLAVDEDG